MILEEILRHRRLDLEKTRASTSEATLRASPVFAEPRRGFLAAVRQPGRRIVAEVKKASPSRGVIRPDFDPVAIAAEYAENGAAAISVLTEERHFQGRGEYLTAIRRSQRLPLLRKDFIFDGYQLIEARALGADAVLLIVAALDDAALRALVELAEKLELDALVEVHDEGELDRALAAGATLLGINNRDLRTFETSLAVTERLMRGIRPQVTVISESGIYSARDIEQLEASGAHAFLVGEVLMRAPRPGERLRQLLRGEG